jgi:hypothetical protein
MAAIFGSTETLHPSQKDLLDYDNFIWHSIAISTEILIFVTL